MCSLLELRFERSRFKRWLGTLRCVLGKDEKHFPKLDQRKACLVGQRYNQLGSELGSQRIGAAYMTSSKDILSTKSRLFVLFCFVLFCLF